MCMYIKTQFYQDVCVFYLTVQKILYYQDRLTAVAKVANVVVDPTFIIQPGEKLARTVCLECLSSTEGELLVDLGRLAQELGMAEMNITMSWELHRPWEAKCGGGGLTWVYSREASTL